MNLTIEELEMAIYACSLVQPEFWYDQQIVAKARQKLLDQLQQTLDQRYSD